MSALPGEFVERMKWQLGDEAEAFFAALLSPSPTSIRLHHAKGRSPYDLDESVPWCENGYYLNDRPSFHLDPHWHGGAYYVQEASSMIIDSILRQLLLPEDPRIILDVCAAPGGKTGILASHLRSCDVLVANEVVNQRRSILRENLVKGGYLNTFISGEPASSFQIPFADLMLIDAPCTGEGMMRKDAEAIRQWSPALVQSCSLMQQQIVHQATKALKPEGILIYSTCSYSMDENIVNIQRFIESGNYEPLILSFPGEWNIQTIHHKQATGYQLYPHRVKGEGLFVAVLRKTKSEASSKPLKKITKVAGSIPDWLAPQISGGQQLLALKNMQNHPVFFKEAEEKIQEVIREIPGAELLADPGEQKGKDFIPSHFLAMAKIFHESTPILALDYRTALDFLERQTNTLPTGHPSGWYVIQYDQTILGWAKNTQQGWRNHYPMNWRLRDRRPRKDAHPE
jgi:16S rRNA C967 or C1407 C5-methylase (RsmB/RsmF family)